MLKSKEKTFSVAPMMDFQDPPSPSRAYDVPYAECVQEESA
jgi:hypothetical protein